VELTKIPATQEKTKRQFWGGGRMGEKQHCTIKELEHTVQYFYSVFYLTMLLIDKII
jgi:hypothetical protein